MKTKICSKCNIEKSLDEFHNHCGKKDGKRSQCKICFNQYYIDNKVKINEHRQQYAFENKVKIKEQCKQWRLNHPDKIQEYNTRRRGWDVPQPLNEYFPDSHLHHLHLINSDTGEYEHQACIHVPSQLHNTIYHAWHNRETMLKINELAFEFLYSQIK